MKILKLPASLLGLRVQVLLWTVLPLIIFLLIFALSGVSSHQSLMRALAAEENSRLVVVMAELVAVEVENIALRSGVPVTSVETHALDLEQLLRMDHQHAVSSVLLLDSRGRTLFRYGDAYLQSDLLPSEGIEPALQRESGVLFTSESAHGDIVAYAPVPNRDWAILIRESWHSLTAPLIRFEEVVPLILFIAVAVSLLILYFGVRYLVNPLRELGLRAARIGSGEFTSIAQPQGGIKEITDLSMALDDMARHIQSYQAALHHYVGAVTKAQEEERARVARELHDETVQTLIALGHKAQMVQRSLARDPAAAEDRITELRQMLTQALDEVRRFSRAMHPHALEELGLISALETLASEANAQFEAVGSLIRFNAEKELAIYRIAQEALNNARRHSQAEHIMIRLEYQVGSVVLQISDDGVGFTVPDYFYDLTKTGHFGLIGMRERVQLIGGILSIASKPGKGTNLVLEVAI